MLFDNNFGFITYDLSKNDTKDSNKELVSLEEGLKRGNMFTDEYVPYKNYNVSLAKPNDNKEFMLYEIMMLTFALEDLNLYLDLHPKDKKILDKFNELNIMKVKKESDYVNLYGPLMVNDTDYNEKFTWINIPWPWDKGDGKYV